MRGTNISKGVGVENEGKEMISRLVGETQNLEANNGVLGHLVERDEVISGFVWFKNSKVSIYSKWNGTSVKAQCTTHLK